MGLLTSPTLSDLIREVRLFLNQPNAANSFWSDEELTREINNGIRQYFLVLNEVAEGQFDTTATLDITATVETVALPTDLYEIRALYAVWSNKKQILPYYNNVSESYFTDSGNSINQYAPYYYFRANSIVLRPIPSFSQTGGLFLEYTKFPETLITGMDALTSGISPIFRELVVAFCIYKAKLKESSTTGNVTMAPILSHLQDLFGRFKDSIASRSKFPQKIRQFSP